LQFVVPQCFEQQMPPKGKLPDSVVADFTTWIRLGLPDPRTSDQPVTTRQIDIVAGRQHWAFQPVTDPPLPPVADTAWPLDPIDHFVLAKLQAAGLQPQPDAERWQWLRRVS
ncbi:MAG: hypothetical protein ACKPJD_26920, partial [Planctomycetaceae bacterium]